MGCCESTNNSTKSLAVFSVRIKEAIDSGSISRVGMIVSLFKSYPGPVPIIDQEIICVNTIKLNSLAYALFLNKVQIFRYLYDKGASLKAMDQILEQSNLRAINIICYKGHKEMLEYYLPFYLKDYSSLPVAFKSFTIDLKDTITTRKEFDLAIHSACRSGMIHIVLYLYKHFKEKNYCPSEFNIKEKDEYFGEDAGLIACRVGNFALVKMLHEVCGVDFKQVNNHNENAITVLLSGFRNSPNYSFVECLSYLIEIVNLDITENYEESLYLAEGEEMVTYLETQLEKKGISVKKKDIDQNQVNFRVAKDTLVNMKEPYFNEETRRYIDADRSFLSSISEIESKFDNTHSCLLNEFD